jgi:hypothetical protein
MNGNNIYIMCDGVIIAGTKSNEITSDTELLEVSGPKSGRSREYTIGRDEWGFTTSFLVLSNEHIKDLLKKGTTYDIQVVARNGSSSTGLLQGKAILKNCKMTFTRGNLAQGSFQFVGNGPLEDYVNVSSISLSRRSLLLIQGDSETLIPTILPSNAGNKNLAWSSSNQSVATVDQDGNVTAVGSGSCTITCAATDGSGVFATCNFKTVELVDLGLPSGTLWATCNIGANSPEEFGDHFAWAETEPKENYSWETYKYCEGTSNTLTKYCTDAQYGTVDDLVSLNAVDDAARKISNQKLWTPTTVRITELTNSNYTTIEHTTLNGVSGVRITSKSNANSIFLPLSPCIEGETPSQYSRYMSRNNNPTTSYYSVALQISEDNVEIITDTMRCFGFSVRPIYIPE